MGPVGSPYSRGTPGVRTAQPHSGTASSHCPLSPALSPLCTPGSPPQHLGCHQQPRAEQFLRQEHTQRLSPSTREEKTPSRQTRAAPSLPPSSHNPDFFWPLLLQTSQGWAFTPLRERVSPNLPCTASHSSSPSPGAAECRRSCRSPRGFHHPALPQVWQLLKWVRPASENKEKQSNFVLALN